MLIKNLKLKIKNLVGHPLFSGSAIMFIGNMSANVVNYVYHLVMGRFLGPVEYGVLASIYSIMYLVSIIPTSASVSIVKFISSSDINQTYSVYLAIKKIILKLSIIMSFLILLCSGLIAKFLKIDSIIPVVLLSPILFLSLITLVNQATSQGLIKFMGNVVPILISSILKFLLGFTFVYIGWSVSGAVFAVIIGMFFAYIYSAAFIKKYLHVTEIKTIDITPFLKYSVPVLLQSLAFTSIFTIDVLLAKHFLDPFSAGIYAAISTLGKIIFFATSPITATMFPVISKRKALNQGFIKVFITSMLITTAIAVTITMFYWIFPNIAIGVLYGKDYLSARSDLVWMGMFMLFYTLSNLLVNFYLSIGNVKIVYIPLIAAFIQAITIWLYHDNITQILHVSLLVTFTMFICLLAYTGYNLLYEEKNK